MPYSEADAARAIRFVENLKHTKGRWSGVPFTLLPWQEQIMRDVFGTVKEDGYRQYTMAYVEIGKKNGKSELGAAVGLYLTSGDNEPGAEVYGCAVDRQQASIVFDVAVDMVDQCKALKKRMKLILSQKRMVYEPTRSFYQVLSAEAFSKHGLNVHGVIFDELHAQPNRDLWDVMTKGSGDARTQPLFFVITTAGDDPDRTSICWEIHQKAKSQIDGRINDPSFYPVIYGLGEGEDWTKEENWYKANPSLGHTIQIERVRSDFENAKINPADEKTFRWLRLNQWVKVKASKWVSLETWDRNAGYFYVDRLGGSSCYGGLDLSSKLDLSAFVLVFPPNEEESTYKILPFFWLPEEGLAEKEKKDSVPYQQWAREGLIRLTPGNSIDYNFIRQDIVNLSRRYQIKEIGFDPWNAYQLATDLTEDYDLMMVEVRQGMKSMSPPMKELEAFLADDKIEHNSNPVMRWMFGNVEVKMDENGNVRPVKGKKKEKIDGVVALINAMSRVIVHKDTTSVYEDRGLLIL